LPSLSPLPTRRSSDLHRQVVQRLLLIVKVFQVDHSNLVHEIEVPGLLVEELLQRIQRFAIMPEVILTARDLLQRFHSYRALLIAEDGIIVRGTLEILVIEFMVSLFPQFRQQAILRKCEAELKRLLFFESFDYGKRFVELSRVKQRVHPL